jgi:UDP-N-acetylglucosamine:LPS N-acetylglucosamine transferase
VPATSDPSPPWSARVVDPGTGLEPWPPAPPPPGASVAVVSASVGAGHDGAARELSRRLRAAGTAVRQIDFLDILPAGCGRLLRATYHAELTWAPRTWGWVAGATSGGATAARTSGVLGRLAGDRMVRAVGADPALVISTYPLASQLLGRLRRDGRMPSPALTFLTDMSVHPLWVAPGIDTHLALHAVPAGQARDLGAARTVVAGPAVHPAFRPAVDGGERLAARSAFGLPAHEALALVVAGSWGVGAVDRSARAIADTGLAVPVVVCGHNDALRRRLDKDPRVVALGWVDDMPTLMRAGDLVVQNAGGLTSLEALASGVPVISYECLPGHGRTNAAGLDTAGWAPWVRERGDLGAALARALREPVPVTFTAAEFTATLGAIVAGLWTPGEASVEGATRWPYRQPY